jgi:serpin B
MTAPKSKIFACMLFLSALLTACLPAPANLVQSPVGRDADPNIPSGNLASLVDGNNAFAMDLYHSLISKSGNLVLSPYSISLALAMTEAGARGQTANQMAESLHFLQPDDQLHAAFNQLDQDLEKNSNLPGSTDQAFRLNIANGIWAQQDHPFQTAFLDLLARNYGAGVHLADFVTKADSVRSEINDWVSNKTEGKIQNLIAPGGLDPLTRMVLVNAIYFKADWQNQFDPNSTQDGPFHLVDGSQIQVKLMSNNLHGILYTQIGSLQAVELPYQGGSTAMDILVPDSGTFNNFESTLDSKALIAILGSYQRAEVDLALPKFRYSSQFGLADTLKGLGMTDAFDMNTADFTGMDGQRDLYIGAVVHQAFVSVDEKGTEAAAATAVIMETGSAPLHAAIRLVVDRPFLFLIRDLKSGQILFIGRVMSPA